MCIHAFALIIVYVSNFVFFFVSSHTHTHTHTDGVDYDGINEIATIASGGIQGALGCVYIDTIDDDLIEDPEYFSIHLIIFDHRVIATNIYIEIRIIDNGNKINACLHACNSTMPIVFYIFLHLYTDVRYQFSLETPFVNLTSLHLSLEAIPPPVSANCTVSRSNEETMDCKNIK